MRINSPPNNVSWHLKSRWNLGIERQRIMWVRKARDKSWNRGKQMSVFQTVGLFFHCLRKNDVTKKDRWQNINFNEFCFLFFPWTLSDRYWNYELKIH